MIETTINPLTTKIHTKMNNQFLQEFYWLMPVLIILIIWETVWKLIAMWKAGRNNHLTWFIIIAIINTVGILPIIYLLMQKNKSKNHTQPTIQQSNIV